MRRLRLSTLLVVVNAGLLFLAVAGVALSAARLLRQLSDDQALARVEQAGLAARSVIRLAGKDAATSARLLAERPTLLRHILDNDSSALHDFISQFQKTSSLDSIAVFVDDTLFAEAGPPLDWANLWRGHSQASNYFVFVEGGGTALALAMVAPVPGRAGAHVAGAVLLNDDYARQISAEIGLPVRFNPPGDLAGDSALDAARRQAMITGEVVAIHLASESPARYVAIAPFGPDGGTPAGLLETELASESISGPVRQLTQSLLLLALLVALLAAGLNLAIGQRLGRPLTALTRAAARIGYGDLATPITPAAGPEMETLAATMEDMRRRLLALTADLRRQQAESGAIVAGIVEGVFTVDEQRRIRYANPQVEAMLGIEPGSAVGRFCGDVLNPRGPGGLRPCEEDCPIIHARFQGGARATERLMLASGPIRTVTIASAPPGEPPAAGAGRGRQVQIMRDETEIEAGRRMRDAVLANISHEFRTPLAAQLASIELLLDQLPMLSQEQVGDLVLSLQQGALRLTQLIDNLLEGVRIEAGQRDIRRQSVALDEVVENALEMTRPLLEVRGQPVTVELPYPLPPVLGDGPRLTQVFVNLLANASKFSAPGAEIEVGASTEADSVHVWVQDNGPGLAHMSAQRLFERFDRAAELEPEAGGVGLGLWIVKSIVERHGGTVGPAESERGTRMVVTLPRLTAKDET